MILGEGDKEFVHSLFHEYDPVKRHEYYERTKKLKGRKKGGFAKIKSRHPVPYSRYVNPLPTPQQQVDFKTKSNAAQVRIDQTKELVRRRNEAEAKRKQNLAKAKQTADATEAKRFELENKKLDLQTTKLDLDAQQSDLVSKRSELEKAKTTEGVDLVLVSKAEKMLEIEAKKLDIRRKKFELESQKVDAELQKLGPPKKKSPLNPNLVSN